MELANSMKSFNTLWNKPVIVLDDSMTFGNLRLSNSKHTCPNGFELPSSGLKTKENYLDSIIEDNTENYDVLNYYETFPASNQVSSIDWYRNEITSNKQRKCMFTSVRESSNDAHKKNNNNSEVSTSPPASDESFSTLVNNHKYNNNIKNPKAESFNSCRPLRVFNRNGKPLSDRKGRPLIDIMGQSLVIFDEHGRLVSDSRGNQIFNCLGESAVFSNTNLFVSPLEEEPEIPLLDIDKKHILFLYDSKGHPMTDYLGRPLVKASGSLMFGISQNEQINFERLKHNKLKNMYGKAPLENCVRHIQIFDGDLKSLTDENGKMFKSAKIFCNKNGMPVCDATGRPCLYKYGSRIMESPTLRRNATEQKGGDMENEENSGSNKPKLKPNSGFLNTATEDKFKRRKSDSGIVYKDGSSDSSFFETKFDGGKSQYTDFDQTSQKFSDNADKLCIEDKIEPQKEENISIDNNNDQPSENFPDTGIAEYQNTTSPRKQLKHNFTKCKHKFGTIYGSKEAVVLFDGSKRMKNHKSLMNTVAFKTLKGSRQKKICHSVWKRKPYKEMFKTNFMEYFKNAIHFAETMQNTNDMLYNDYGKPIKDMYGHFLYDKYGIPMTGANGVKLSDQARHALRLKLRNIPVIPINQINPLDKENIKKALTLNQSMDQFGQPNYDKCGRPLYDLFGKLIYDSYGRPLTDAFGRPLIDAIGQPMMDSKGNVLTSVSGISNSDELTDVFGRRLYDKKGRPLFDSYGRPRFDIFTNAIYDNCGRPATDGNGCTLYDFLNQPIKPFPEKPLYRNARVSLPKYIDQILTMPSMHILLKYSRTSLNDAFGGPLFDDFGRPMYNKIGKPVYDKYGRPLYNKDGKPLCDCYGRPLSEDICKSSNDTTLSVVDSLKLLKLTKESSKWMEIKRSEMQALKDTKSQVLGKFSLKSGRK